MKRILSITIQREDDTDPDTSYLGEYGNTAKTEFAIDRWHDLTCASVNPENLVKVEDIEKRIAEVDKKRITTEDETAYSALVAEQDALIEQQDKLISCDCHGGVVGRHEYRYFNPGTVESFSADASWIPADVADKEAHWRKAMRENARQDFERMESLQNGDWGYIGIRAQAEINVDGTIQTIRSGGLWGIESDSDASYFAEVAAEELGELRRQLHSLGFSKRAIATAVKDVLDQTV